MSKTAVAVKADNTAAAVPSFMQNDAGKGLVDVSAADMEIPRIKLLQALSPELTEFDNLKQGTFFHSVLEEGLGVVICAFHYNTTAESEAVHRLHLIPHELERPWYADEGVSITRVVLQSRHAL